MREPNSAVQCEHTPSMNPDTVREHLDRLQSIVAGSLKRRLTAAEHAELVGLCAVLQDGRGDAEARVGRLIEEICLYVVTAMETLEPGPESKSEAVLKHIAATRTALRL